MLSGREGTDEGEEDADVEEGNGGSAAVLMRLDEDACFPLVARIVVEGARPAFVTFVRVAVSVLRLLTSFRRFVLSGLPAANSFRGGFTYGIHTNCPHCFPLEGCTELKSVRKWGEDQEDTDETLDLTRFLRGENNKTADGTECNRVQGK